MAEFDPSRAKLETVRALCLALSDYEQRVDDIDTEEPEGKCLMGALTQWREQCRSPLRTRAEVDAEIADEVRRFPFLDYRAKVTITGIVVERLRSLAREPTSDSGPSSVDAADGGPPPAVPVSPAGAAFHQRVCDLLGLSDGYHGAYVYADEERVLLELRELKRCADAYAGIRHMYGPPGAAAAKESSDTTAAAPAGAALEDPDCNCDQALELQRRLDKARDDLFDRRRAIDAIHDLATQIVGITGPTQE
jgi:hypothetical protein